MNNIPILILCVFFACTDGFAQTPTPITTENYDSAIEACLCIDPVNGLCSESGYGAMPDWDMRNVTNLAEAFLNRTEFNGGCKSVQQTRQKWQTCGSTLAGVKCCENPNEFYRYRCCEFL